MAHGTLPESSNTKVTRSIVRCWGAERRMTPRPYATHSKENQMTAGKPQAHALESAGAKIFMPSDREAAIHRPDTVTAADRTGTPLTASASQWKRPPSTTPSKTTWSTSMAPESFTTRISLSPSASPGLSPGGSHRILAAAIFG